MIDLVVNFPSPLAENSELAKYHGDEKYSLFRIWLYKVDSYIKTDETQERRKGVIEFSFNRAREVSLSVQLNIFPDSPSCWNIRERYISIANRAISSRREYRDGNEKSLRRRVSTSRVARRR